MRIYNLLALFLVLTLTACGGDSGEKGAVTEMPAPPIDQSQDGFDPIGSVNIDRESYEIDDAQARPGTQEDLVVNVGDRVLFGFDQSDLTSDARDVLDNQALWLKRYPHIHVTIEGHTDERGTREYNLALGDRRATTVKNYLVALGVDKNRITTISYGKERPAVPESNPQAWAQNRRAVTVVE